MKILDRTNGICFGASTKFKNWYLDQSYKIYYIKLKMIDQFKVDRDKSKEMMKEVLGYLSTSDYSK